MNRKRITYFCIGLAVIIVLCLFLILTKNQFNAQKKQETISLPTLNPPTPTFIPPPLILKSSSSIISLRAFQSNYGFSLLYPSDWRLLDQPSVTGIEIQKINTQGTGFSISIRINQNPQKLSLLEYTKNQAFTSSTGQQDVPEMIKTPSLQGYKLHYLPEGILATIYLQEKLPDKVLYIFAGGEYDKSSQTISYYNQIINTILNSIQLN